MIASTHIAAGLVAGMTSASLTKNRFLRLALAFILALASHLLLDAIPHSDYGSLSRSAIRVLVPVEFVVVCAVGASILRGRLQTHWPEYLLAGLFGSVLPDAKFIASIVLSDRNARLVENYGNRLHEGFHAGPTSLAVGVTTQVACAILLLACLYAFPRTSSPPARGVRRSVA